MPPSIYSIEANQRDAEVAIQHRVLASATRQHFKYWCYQVQYCRIKDIKPYFSTLSKPIITLLKGFTARARSGYYSQGYKVRMRTVCITLSAITQTILIDREAIYNLLLMLNRKSTSYLLYTSSKHISTRICHQNPAQLSLLNQWRLLQKWHTKHHLTKKSFTPTLHYILFPSLHRRIHKSKI